MVERVDAVVVGAGLAGLAAAVTLADAGLKTVVLEQNSVPGGYVSSFERGPNRFDCQSAVSGLAPGGGGYEHYRQLGIWDRLRLHRLDPLYVVRGPGRKIVAHADPVAYEAELLRNFPDQANQIRAYLDEARAVYRDIRRIGIDQDAGRDPTLEEIVARYPAMVQASVETWEEMMARHVSDRQVRSALGTLWFYGMLPPSRLAAVIGVGESGHYHEHGGWYPEGGAQAISGALVQSLRERGGELRCGQLVTGFDVEGDRVVAVTTDQGLRLEAGVVVSDASAPTTVLELIGREHLPADYVDRVERPTPSYSTFTVYLGLDRDVPAEQGLTHQLFLNPSWDDDAALQAAQSGDWARALLMITDHTHVDPGCAPQGHAVVTLMTLASWDYQDTWGTGGDLIDYHANPRYLRLKEQAADALVARAANEVPGLADAIQYREAMTPLTNFHLTRNPRGAAHGYENTPANSGLGWLPNQTPITNLFLVGAWTNSGGMSPAVSSGLLTARQILARS